MLQVLPASFRTEFQKIAGVFFLFFRATILLPKVLLEKVGDFLKNLADFLKNLVDFFQELAASLFWGIDTSQ